MLICGLGNPGSQYENTPHNAGFSVIDALATTNGITLSSKFNSLIGAGSIAGTGSIAGADCLGVSKVTLVKPLGFMNTSGGPLKQVASYFKVPIDEIIVVHDDIDLDFGKLKVKVGGGDGGHNGLKSITSALGSANYKRVRIGVGRGIGSNPGDKNAANWVLKKLTGKLLEEYIVLIDEAVNCTEFLLSHTLEETQQRFH